MPVNNNQVQSQIKNQLQGYADRGAAIMQAKNAVRADFMQQQSEKGFGQFVDESSPKFQKAFLNKVQGMGLTTENGTKITDLMLKPGGILAPGASSMLGTAGAAHNAVSLEYNQAIANYAEKQIIDKGIAADTPEFANEFRNLSLQMYSNPNLVPDSIKALAPSANPQDYLHLSNGIVLKNTVTPEGKSVFQPVLDAAGKPLKVAENVGIRELDSAAPTFLSRAKGFAKGPGKGFVVAVAASMAAEKLMEKWEIHQYGGALGMAKVHALDCQKIINEVNKLSKNRQDVVNAGVQVMTKINDAIVVPAPANATTQQPAQPAQPAQIVDRDEPNEFGLPSSNPYLL